MAANSLTPTHMKRNLSKQQKCVLYKTLFLLQADFYIRSMDKINQCLPSFSTTVLTIGATPEHFSKNNSGMLLGIVY